MTDISKRIKALFFLRVIFLISLIAGLGSFLTEAIALSFGEGHVFSEAGSMTIYVFVSIFTILKLLVIVLVAATLILSAKVNKECLTALCFALVAAVLAILSGVFQYISDTKLVGWILGLVSGLVFAAATFLLIDGIFDKQARKTPLFSFATLGICLMVVSNVLSFLVYLIKTPEGLQGAVYSAAEVTAILYSAILFLAIHLCLKEIKNTKESEAI